MAAEANHTYTIETLREFVAAQIGTPVSKVKAESDIDFDLGCTGLDFDSLMEAYRETFKVNMDNYLWYFHTGDESGCGALFYVAPYEQVVHMPITAAKLLEFANKGYWDVAYPEHKISERPNQAWVRWLVVGLLLLVSFKACMS